MFTIKLEWYKPQEKMPNADTTEVLIITDNLNIHEVGYDSSRELFNVYKGSTSDYAMQALYWAYIPTQEIMAICYEVE